MQLYRSAVKLALRAALMF